MPIFKAFYDIILHLDSPLISSPPCTIAERRFHRAVPHSRQAEVSVLSPLRASEEGDVHSRRIQKFAAVGR